MKIPGTRIHLEVHNGKLDVRLEPRKDILELGEDDYIEDEDIEDEDVEEEERMTEDDKPVTRRMSLYSGDMLFPHTPFPMINAHTIFPVHVQIDVLCKKSENITWDPITLTRIVGKQLAAYADTMESTARAMRPSIITKMVDGDIYS